METIKSLDYIEVITALLCDVQNKHGDVFTQRALRLTVRKVRARYVSEGVGFLTKTLPRLGKHFDKVLAGNDLFDSTKCGFKPAPGSKLPIFLGELFKRVLSTDGEVLQVADANCVLSIRQICFVFYKLELPYDTRLERNVVDKFVRTEFDVARYHKMFDEISNNLESSHTPLSRSYPSWWGKTICGARERLNRLFQAFDPKDIYPRHGPGAVSTKEVGPEKYTWTSIPKRLTDVYPLDAYFFASAGHLCDSYQSLSAIESEKELLARVCLVPKDSRGPRLISCEPLAFQWIQQGLAQAMVLHVERHHLTRDNVRFTNQEPNRMAAIYGSVDGKYATLDLNEASDRVSCGLVRLLFPGHVLECLMSSRSLGTVLPDKRELFMTKFAPMGSALCFPVLALTVWSLLSSGLETLGADADVLSSIYVYGDDVIVPTAWAENAMTVLESFGLKINRDKSCTRGFFRESCGMDAYRGVDVTPVRIRTPWSSHRSPEVYTSWISYCRSMWNRQYFNCYYLIVGELLKIYQEIPTDDMRVTAPSLPEVPDSRRRIRSRVNTDLQKVQYFVWDVSPASYTKVLPGWNMLLRYFAEVCSAYENTRDRQQPVEGPASRRESYILSPEKTPVVSKFSVSEYTWRKRMKMRKRWR